MDYFSQKKATPSQQLEQSRLLFTKPSVLLKQVSQNWLGTFIPTRSEQYVAG
jgi:hypothetical protein